MSLFNLKKNGLKEQDKEGIGQVGAGVSATADRKAPRCFKYEVLDFLVVSSIRRKLEFGLRIEVILRFKIIKNYVNLVCLDFKIHHVYKLT